MDLREERRRILAQTALVSRGGLEQPREVARALSEARKRGGVVVCGGRADARGEERGGGRGEER